MMRLWKAILLPLRKIAYRWNRLRLYYWAESQLVDLTMISVMPIMYYRCLYHLCLWLVELKRFRKVANYLIHTIPYHIRFAVA